MWARATRMYEVTAGMTRVGRIFCSGSIGDDGASETIGATMGTMGDDVTIDASDRMSETMGDVSRATIGGTIGATMGGVMRVMDDEL